MRRTHKITVALAGLTLATLLAQGQEEGGLKPGDAAPAFELRGSDGKMHSLEEYAGRSVVIAWFPKAFTGG